jgi:hypothetical protein
MTAESNHRGASVVALVISLAALVLTLWMVYSAQASDDLYADEIGFSDSSVVIPPPASDARQAPQAAAAQAAPPASPPQSQR